MILRLLKHQDALIRAAAALAVPAAFWAGGAYAADADFRLTSVTPVGADRYDITGIAIDELVNPACALVLASGQCMFSCGPVTFRCDGTTVELPFSRFELLDLPLDENGNIPVQVFIEGHIPVATPIAPEPLPDAARWGVLNTYCCPSARSTFAVTIDGVTKRSTNSTCSFDREWEPTWWGWSRAPSTPFEVTAQSDLESQTEVPAECEVYSGAMQTRLSPGRCYLYTLRAVNGLPEMFEEEVDCARLP
jgi:hypothetical protein